MDGRRSRLPSVFDVETCRHKILNPVFRIPRVVFVYQPPRVFFNARADFDLIICGEVALAGNMCEKVRDVTEVGLLGAYVAVKWNTAPRGHAVRVEAAYALADESGSSWFEGT